ncbi:MAG TPA: hypothetical protein VMV27_08710 [Candidatus Binataceae bacterium]|nr:hypothetical protein [Candidatus Binataceae bacterium]
MASAGFQAITAAALALIVSAWTAPALAQAQPSSAPHAPAAIAPNVTQGANHAAAVAAAAENSTPQSPQAASSAAAMQQLPRKLGGPAANPSPIASAPPTKKTIREKVRAVVKSLNPSRILMDHQFTKAAAAFPAFCKTWEQKLKQREQNNLAHIAWRFDNGFQTALYTGYSTVESCESHQSAQGFAIGKLSYEEFHYLIKAKNADEEKTAKATPVDDTHTTEIFRWDKNSWFDLR